MNRAQRRAAKMPKQDSVVFGYIHPQDVSATFMASFLRVFRYEIEQNQRIVGTLDQRAGSADIWLARNIIVEQFLEGSGDWLWFVDADMGFPEWALTRLLGVADKDERPIVGGLCFALQKVDVDPVTWAEIYELLPTTHIWNYDDDGQIRGFQVVRDYPDDTVCHVNSTGAACVLIHRSVLERIGSDWWTPLPTPVSAGFARRRFFGEDISFFLRCADLKIPVWLDTCVKTSHDKGGVFLTHELYQQQEARKRALEDILKETADAD